MRASSLKHGVRVNPLSVFSGLAARDTPEIPRSNPLGDRFLAFGDLGGIVLEPAEVEVDPALARIEMLLVSAMTASASATSPRQRG